MSNEQLIDRHLAEVYDAVLVTLYRVKQAAWSVSGTVFADELRALRDFLIEQSRVIDEAETRIGGRAERLSTPSSHQHGNLATESGGDPAMAVQIIAEHLGGLLADVRGRAAEIEGSEEARLLDRLAVGIAGYIARLAA